MCGIAGLVDFNKHSSLSVLKSMTTALHRRGPDDFGYFLDDINEGQVGLGHRRLSILDLSSHGHQPMSYDNLALVYNGEIYNYREIKKELEGYGYKFESSSDTEVVLKAYHKWGDSALSRFNGMFAIAIFNYENRTLTLIRDRAGVKPIYWYYYNGVFLFSSELKSFHEHSSFEKQLDYGGLSLYLQYGYIPQPNAIFKNTYKLEAGSIVELNLASREIEHRSYWNIVDFYCKPKIKLDETEALEETERLLKSACEYRMVSDVPVGVFLSGGYDSTTVTSLLQSERQEKIKTFSIGFYEDSFNEAHYAKKVANYIGTDHTEYYCTVKDAMDLIPEIPNIWDEPFSDNSIIPTTLVSKLAKEDVSVALSADGGDEVFGGYDKYTSTIKYHKYFGNIPKNKLIATVLEGVKPRRRGIDEYIRNFTGRYNRALSLLKENDHIGIMKNSQKVFTEVEMFEVLTQPPPHRTTLYDDDKDVVANLDPYDAMMAVDFKTYQSDNILTKVDRATMSVSLEGREPLLDFRLVEFLAQIDSRLKIKDDNKKFLLKKISEKYIPKELMDRPKMGFNTPIANWFSSDLKSYFEYYLDYDKITEQGIFNADLIVEMKDRYYAGQNHYMGKLWVILVFQLWYEKWM